MYSEICLFMCVEVFSIVTINVFLQTKMGMAFYIVNLPVLIFTRFICFKIYYIIYMISLIQVNLHKIRQV